MFGEMTLDIGPDILSKTLSNFINFFHVKKWLSEYLGNLLRHKKPLLSFRPERQIGQYLFSNNFANFPENDKNFRATSWREFSITPFYFVNKWRHQLTWTKIFLKKQPERKFQLQISIFRSRNPSQKILKAQFGGR